jgi:hypothetical protein
MASLFLATAQLKAVTLLSVLLMNRNVENGGNQK